MKSRLLSCLAQAVARLFNRCRPLLLLFPAIALLLAACGAPKLTGTLYDPIIDAPEIVGIQQDGSPFRLSDLQGKPALIFFGYTFCPDICPTTLGTMTQVMAQLGRRADDLAVVFISIDPERDTPERLAAYIMAFDERFYGVHLDAAALQQATSDYGVYAEKRTLDEAASSADYFMDHTGWIYVVDAQGRLREIFANDAPAETIAPDVRALMARAQG